MHHQTTMDQSQQATSSTWNTLSSLNATEIFRKNNNTTLHPKNVDAMLAQLLNSLSFRDRTAIQEEVHGFRSLAPEETPEMVDRALLNLQSEIDKLPSASRPAHDRAISLQSDYVHSTDFRIKFLRAELFDAEKAAIRFTTYLNFVHKYFGDTALMRPLCFEDLTTEEQDETQAGFAQTLPSRDRFGRLVRFYRHQILTRGEKLPSLKSRMRQALYEAGILADDEETQRKGLVGIYVIHPDSSSFIADPRERDDYKEMLSSYPVRWSAIHLVLPSGPIYHFVKAVIMMNASYEHKIRTCFYCGFNMETKYKLMCFGLNVADLPLTNSGILKNKVHNQYLKLWRTVEIGRMDGIDISTWVIYPGVHDVLFSKGGNPRHQGNLNFQCIMELKMDAYNSRSSRKEGKQIRDEMVEMVYKKGGKFLELNKKGGYWTEITSTDVLHAKINTSMYDHNRRLLARASQQQFETEASSFLGYKTSVGKLVMAVRSVVFNRNSRKEAIWNFSVKKVNLVPANYPVGRGVSVVARPIRFV